MSKNYVYANKGMGLEDEIIKSNEGYLYRGIANIQKISTPWSVRWEDGKIAGAHPKGKSTLDFRGTIYPCISVSFDCKETKDERGLPLSNITGNQINYIKNALFVHEISFVVCFVIPLNKRYVVPGDKILFYWKRWLENKGKHGFNCIPVDVMTEITPNNGIVLDYIAGLKRCTNLKKIQDFMVKILENIG